MANYFNLTIDTTAPKGVFLNVNNGATRVTSTTITLNISCSDADKTGYQMKIWSTCLGLTEETAVWKDYSADEVVTFTPPETLNPALTFYAKVRDDVWNESATAFISIQYLNSVPTVNINSASRSKISAVNGKSNTVVEFSSDMPFDEYKICAVSTVNTTHSGGTTLKSAYVPPETTEYSDTLNRDSVSSNPVNSLAEGVHIIKVFVKDAVSGNWSV